MARSAPTNSSRPSRLAARRSASGDALGRELLQQLQARLARAALEPVEQAFGGEVDAHGPQA